MLRRFQALIMIFLLLLSAGPAGPAAAAENGELPFEVTARSAVLMDVHTGKVLYAHNPDEEILPASLAKIMTMILALEALEEGRVAVDSEVVVSEAAWTLALQGRQGGVSAMFIEVGETVRLEELLYGIGVLSGNDAALAIAEHLAGTEEAFVDLMNRRAAELGLTHTRFANSHGLSGGTQHTTARDMARLAAIFVEDHHHGLQYMSAKEYTHAGIAQTNRNGLLFTDSRVNGLKTGYLSASGWHLVATAEEGEMALAAAVLGASGDNVREQEASALLNYGFQNYVTFAPAWGEGGQRSLRVYKGQADEVRVRPGRRPVVTVPRDATGRVEVTDDLPGHLEAPVAAGERVGTLTVRLDEHEEIAVPLVAADEVERGGFFKVLLDSIRLLFQGLRGG